MQQQLAVIKKYFNKLSTALQSVDWKAKLAAIPIPSALTNHTLLKNFKIPRNLKFLQNLRHYTFYYNALLIICCTYFVADFFATALTPFIPDARPPKTNYVSKPPKNLSQYNQIFSRNLFNERGLIPEVDDMNSDDGPPIKTSLPLNLVGVIVVRDELKRVASVEDRGTNQVTAVRVNDYINPDALVQKIESTKVIFFNRNSGRREFIDLPQDSLNLTTRRGPSVGAGIQKSSDNHYNIDRATVDKTLANINQVLTEARCVPNIENGRPSGYRCFQIVPGSIYDMLGLKDNDVICGLNGEPINDPGKAFEIFSQLKNLSAIDICINRNGQVMNTTYDIH